MPRTTWDDEACLRFAEAYDGEDAAQRGERNPHAEKGEGYAEWAAGRITCVRAGLGAVTRDWIKRNTPKGRMQ